MWSIAPIPKIQSWEEIKEGAVKLAENTKCSRDDQTNFLPYDQKLQRLKAVNMNLKAEIVSSH